ncbi:hypothetical protein LX95_00931 [Mesonia algae]|uniref:Uncharacterized protein n=2 Tax=Mesonia algae TaxID=213248 RepID=A0A2W7IC55_9FLAO|nr:hypothetical protein LX95_00931 [Mesonia algae]
MSLSKKNKITLFMIILVCIAGYSAYKYTYKSHKSITEKEVVFSGSTAHFLEKVKTGGAKWQDVVVALNGKITSIGEKGITLDHNTYCQFKNSTALTHLKEGQHIAVKGRMIGYDDLLEEIKLDQTLIK